MYPCSICNRQFSGQYSLNLHFESEHNPEDLDDTIHLDYNSPETYDPKIKFIFTYGTLCQNSDYPWSKQIKELCDSIHDVIIYGYQLGIIKGKQYPTLVKSEKKSRVIGQIYGCESEFKFVEMLKFADHVENYPNLYVRKIIHINLNGKDVDCYTYFYNGNNSVKKIKSESYLDHLSSR